jgi:hypothetical protein
VKSGQGKKHFYLVSLVHLIIFIPFVLQKSIGPDWDSYALIGTITNLYKDSLYLPSRPPGFPIYEFFLTCLYSLSNVINIEFEVVFLISQYLFVLANNYLIHQFYIKLDSKNYLLYYIVVFSPIYLTSGLSIIDYHAGLFFGFLGIYMALYRSHSLIFVTIALAISAGIRLSNILFFIVVVSIFIRSKIEYKKIILLSITTIILTFFIYIPGYINLWKSSLSSNLTNYLDMVCVFNLTNIDHSLIDRFGRFILKQIDFLGIIGSIIVLVIITKVRKEDLNNNYYFFLIFILFQISFLRLPTEEGHLLPAFVAFVFILNAINTKKVFLIIIFISTLLSNFIYISIYDVDMPDQATEIYFNFDIKQGLLFQDYETRGEIGKNKKFHYENSYYSIKNVWKTGCPN